MTLWLLAGCAPDLVALHAWDDGADARDTADTAAPPARVDTVAIGDGLFRSRVDARDALAVVGVDFDASGVESEVPGSRWDLAGRRFHLALNGGVSGEGDVAALFLPGVALADAAVPADPAWLQDAADADGDGEPELVFASWFDYDGETHALTPVDGTWLLRTTDANVVAIRIDGYYGETGDSAVFTLTWRQTP